MNVFRNLKKFLRTSRPSNRLAKRRSARLELESLDQRLLPNASILLSQGVNSPNPLSAVTDITGSATGFYLDPTNAGFMNCARASLPRSLLPAR